MFARRLAVIAGTIGLLASGGALAATAASASTTYTGTTQLTNRADSGNNTDNGGNWAVDTLTRTATLVDNGLASPGVESYTMTLSDTGTFVTDAAASNPNGTNPSQLIAHQPISGTVTGSGEFTFTVASSVGVTNRIPVSQDGNPVASSDWPQYFFPSGTTITYVDPDGQEGVFSYTYETPQTCQTWVDASSNGDGAGAADGGISGYGQCPVNVANPGTQTTHVGSGASLQMIGSTGSSDSALTWSATGLPAGLSINASTGLISGIPLSPAENTDIVKVTATDAYGASAHVFFAWDTTNALVPDVLSLKYVCGFGHPRNNAELTVVSGSYVAHVNLVAVQWGGRTVGDGTVVVAPGHPIRVSALNSVAIRGYYNANGSQPPASEAGTFFIFSRIPGNGADGRSC